MNPEPTDRPVLNDEKLTFMAEHGIAWLTRDLASEVLALRARVTELEAEVDRERGYSVSEAVNVVALRARVTELEAALTDREIRNENTGRLWLVERSKRIECESQSRAGPEVSP